MYSEGWKHICKKLKDKKEGHNMGKTKKEFRTDLELGFKVKDKVTGLEGIATARIDYLYGCRQYGVTPEAKDGKTNDTCWFDEGRLEILGQGISEVEVASPEPGPEFNDHPARII